MRFPAIRTPSIGSVAFVFGDIRSCLLCVSKTRSDSLMIFAASCTTRSRTRRNWFTAIRSRFSSVARHIPATHRLLRTHFPASIRTSLLWTRAYSEWNRRVLPRADLASAKRTVTLGKHHIRKYISFSLGQLSKHKQVFEPGRRAQRYLHA